MMTLLIDDFLNAMSGYAFITDLNSGELLMSNYSHLHFLNSLNLKMDEDKEKSTLSKFITESKEIPLVAANFSYCKHVENKFKETLSPTVAKELFCGEVYYSLRVLVPYKGTPAILTIICHSEKDITEGIQNECMSYTFDMKKNRE